MCLRFAVRERTGRAVEEALRAVVPLVMNDHVVPAFITGTRQPVVRGCVLGVWHRQCHILLDMVCSEVILVDFDRWLAVMAWGPSRHRHGVQSL